jgi:hypothetical protein
MYLFFLLLKYIKSFPYLKCCAEVPYVRYLMYSSQHPREVNSYYLHCNDEEHAAQWP